MRLVGQCYVELSVFDLLHKRVLIQCLISPSYLIQSVRSILNTQYFFFKATFKLAAFLILSLIRFDFFYRWPIMYSGKILIKVCRSDHHCFCTGNWVTWRVHTAFTRLTAKLGLCAKIRIHALLLHTPQCLGKQYFSP